MTNSQETTGADTQAGTETTAGTSGAETSTAGNDSVAGASSGETGTAAAPKETEEQKIKAEAEAALADIRADIAELILKLQKNKAAHPVLTEVELGLANALLHLV